MSYWHAEVAGDRWRKPVLMGNRPLPNWVKQIVYVYSSSKDQLYENSFIHSANFIDQIAYLQKSVLPKPWRQFDFNFFTMSQSAQSTLKWLAPNLAAALQMEWSAVVRFTGNMTKPREAQFPY